MPASMTRWPVGGAALLMSLLLAACAGPAVPTPDELNTRYEDWLAATADRAADFAPGGDAERAALDRIEAFFADMTPATVRAATRDVYATDGWLYDNLTIVEGAAAIEAYFEHASGQSDGLSVEFRQIAREGVDYFVRWRMSINAPSLNDGAPLVSYGVTQFRFDAEGKVLMHRDFWDAGTGMYEYLPGIGGMLQSLRARLAAYQ